MAKAIKRECKYGHKWQEPVAQVKKGGWCPKCSVKN